MPIFVPHENVKSNTSIGQAIKKTNSQYIEPELKRRGLKSFSSAGIEIYHDGKSKVYLDDEVQIEIGFKKRKINPSDTGKAITLNLNEIKDVIWHRKGLRKDSAKILLIRFNKDWWIWDADFKKRTDLIDRFNVVTSVTIRGGGYMPLKMRRQEKSAFVKGWQDGLTLEILDMWKRHITVSQKYRGSMVYDGNYFDIFLHAQELFVLGYYYSSVILTRTAAEQALIRILEKSGKGLEIYKQDRGKRKLKSIEQLVETCRSYSLFHKRCPINRIAARKLNEISNISSDLVHPKHDLDMLNMYKKQALICMDNLNYVINRHLNFVKDTGVVSGYRPAGSARRLK